MAHLYIFCRAGIFPTMEVKDFQIKPFRNKNFSHTCRKKKKNKINKENFMIFLAYLPMWGTTTGKKSGDSFLPVSTGAQIWLNLTNFCQLSNKKEARHNEILMYCLPVLWDTVQTLGWTHVSACVNVCNLKEWWRLYTDSNGQFHGNGITNQRFWALIYSLCALLLWSLVSLNTLIRCRGTHAITWSAKSVRVLSCLETSGAYVSR